MHFIILWIWIKFSTQMFFTKIIRLSDFSSGKHHVSKFIYIIMIFRTYFNSKNISVIHFQCVNLFAFVICLDSYRRNLENMNYDLLRICQKPTFLRSLKLKCLFVQGIMWWWKSLLISNIILNIRNEKLRRLRILMWIINFIWFIHWSYL